MNENILLKNKYKEQVLYSFLADHKILLKYKVNTKNFQARYNKTVTNFVKNTDAGNLITLALNWGLTEQGYVFWLKIADAWQEYLQEMQL